MGPAMDGGQVLGASENDDTRINKVVNSIDNQAGQAILENSSGHSNPDQGLVLQWDRFVPSRSMKVLLVENDDSTRHVLTSLLRNCSYEVIAVSDGEQAWKIIEDATSYIDLVLTEVVMPLVSGIGLLIKITRHKTFKNIPVIMMSPHDSMGIVFKCLSKGAVDFLVKPIRKNELKNLWQHVWRRCHSATGSASGTKSNDNSESNTGSSDGPRNNASIGLIVHDGNENGCGSQSLCTKKTAEVETSQPTSCDQLAAAPNVNCSHPEEKVFHENNEKRENIAMGKDLKIGTPRISDFKLEYQPGQVSFDPKKEKATEKDAADAVINCIKIQGENKNLEACNGILQSPSKLEKTGFDSPETSLKRRREEEDAQMNALDDRYLLSHSNNSAFTRYTSGFSKNQKFQVQHHHHHYHHHVYDVHPQQEPEDLNLRTMAANATQCGSSNAIGSKSTRGNFVNNSGNESGSGSNTGSNGQKGSSTDLNGGGANMEIDNVGAKNGKNDAAEDRLARRKAALIKFHQKRKERCFAKKVRYQNRKKVAEQRLRIRGQFVRHMGINTKPGQDNENNNIN